MRAQSAARQGQASRYQSLQRVRASIPVLFLEIFSLRAFIPPAVLKRAMWARYMPLDAAALLARRVCRVDSNSKFLPTQHIECFTRLTARAFRLGQFASSQRRNSAGGNPPVPVGLAIYLPPRFCETPIPHCKKLHFENSEIARQFLERPIALRNSKWRKDPN